MYKNLILNTIYVYINIVDNNQVIRLGQMYKEINVCALKFKIFLSNFVFIFLVYFQQNYVHGNNLLL